MRGLEGHEKNEAFIYLYVTNFSSTIVSRLTFAKLLTMETFKYLICSNLSFPLWSRFAWPFLRRSPLPPSILYKTFPKLIIFTSNFSYFSLIQ